MRSTGIGGRLAQAFAAALGLWTVSAQADVGEVLYLEPHPGAARFDVVYLPEDAARLDAVAAPSEQIWRVTGAYSSGDRFAPEGFVIRRGVPTHPYPQGWDGLLVVARDGTAGIHTVSSVAHGGSSFDLRDRAARARFVEIAAAEQLSAIQSHLLIRDGALDLRPIPGAPRFRRRLLFATDDGRIGLFDTSPDALTLYDAAVALKARGGVRMALNLDMGAYDYCEVSGALDLRYCGVLRREDMVKLTNIVEIRAPLVD